MSTLLDRYYSATRKPLDHPLGYAVAVSGTLMELMCYGIGNCFTTFSSNMVGDPTLQKPDFTKLSYGNSVATGLSPIFGILAGFLVDRLPSRAMLLTSTLLLFLGLWIGSTAKNLEGVVLGYCLLESISSGFMISPCATATGTWFNKRLGIAQGINSCGGGLGNFIIQPIIGFLVNTYGWRKAFRYTSILCIIGVIASVFSCRRAEPSESDDEQESDGIVKGSSSLEEKNTNAPLNDTKKDHSQTQAQSETTVHGGKAEGNSEEGESKHDAFTRDGASNKHDNTSIHSNGGSTGGALEQHEVVQSSTAMNETDNLPSDHKNLMYALHTRRLSFSENLRIYLTRDFLTNFFMYFFFAWTFFGLLAHLYSYFSSMGKQGPYQGEVFISGFKASTLYSFWGAFQIVSCLSIGPIASITSEPFAYIVCSVLCAILCVVTSFCRTYALLAVCMSILGFCTAGIFTLMPCFIVKQFYGPNLGFFMSSIFVGGCVGGFCSPVVTSHIILASGSFTAAFIFLGCCVMISAILCFFSMARHKMCRMPFCSL